MNLRLTFNKPEIFRNVISPLIFTWDDVDFCLNCLPYYINGKDEYVELINHESGRKNDPPIPLINQGWAGTSHDISYIFKRIKLGDSFVISNLSRYNKDINNICKALESITGNAADAHLYGGLHTYSKSFGIHKDTPHNIVVQVDGSCLWRVWKDSVMVVEDTLYPGDVIFVPGAFYHEAIPNGKRLSISFPFGHPKLPSQPDRNWFTLM